jgi:hypothetical protein
MAVAQFEALSWNLSGVTEENHHVTLKIPGLLAEILTRELRRNVR